MLGIRQHQGVQIDLHQGDLTSFVSDLMMVPVTWDGESPGEASCNAVVKAAGPVATMALDGKAPFLRPTVIVAPAGHLPAERLILVVTLDWRRQAKPQNRPTLSDLRAAYLEGFEQLSRLGFRHAAIAPLDGPHRGFAGLPVQSVAEVALQSAREFLDGGNFGLVRRFSFVLPDAEEYQAHRQAMFRFFPEVDQE